MIYYDSLAVYIQSATTRKARLAKIEECIDMLYNTALKAAETDNMSEYSLDDGQTKIKTVYKGTKGVLDAINILEIQKQRLINQINGRITRAVDSKNLNYYRNGRY
jgi:hypothetical protein